MNIQNRSDTETFLFPDMQNYKHKLKVFPKERRKLVFRNLNDCLQHFQLASMNVYGRAMISGNRIC